MRGTHRNRRVPSTTPLQLILHTTAMRQVPDGAIGRLRGFPVGQIVGRMNSARNSKEIILEMIQEFIDVTEKQHKNLAAE